MVLNLNAVQKLDLSLFVLNVVMLIQVFDLLTPWTTEIRWIKADCGILFLFFIGFIYISNGIRIE